ncbi:MAG: CBS domain-containing protein [Candidatus Altiarchaeota archaeon]|nr:CBS domain-containing protein [Candidatus Altiarchaeota archaeon]
MKIPELSEIRKLRKKLGLSQSELAIMAKVSQSLVARVESGDIDPGYSKAASLFSALDSVGKSEVPASEIMSSHVHFVHASDTIEKAAATMKKHEVSQVPVLRKGRIVGSLSESTILNQIASGANAQDLSRRKVSSYAENPLPMISPSTPVTAVSALLESSPAVVVADRGSVLGIVTKADLLKMVHR